MITLSHYEGRLYTEVAFRVLSHVDRVYTQFLESCDVMANAVGDPHPFLSPAMRLSGFVTSPGCPLDTVLVRLESHDCTVASARLWLLPQHFLLTAVEMAISNVVCSLSGDSTTEPASGSADGQVSTLPRSDREVSPGWISWPWIMWLWRRITQ